MRFAGFEEKGIARRHFGLARLASRTRPRPLTTR